MFDLEHSLKLWLRAFRKYRAFDQGSVREMELHLRDHIDDLLAEGYNKQEAFELAVREFGEVSLMAEEEFRIQKRKTTCLSFIRATMLKNYCKTSLRSLMRYPLNSFINIFGLSVAIGISIFAYAFAHWTYSTDQFHEHKQEVHLVTFFADRAGTLQQYGKTPRPLGELLKSDFPHIKKVCRIEDRNVVVKFGEHLFHERLRYTDPDFLEMLTFPLKWGSPGSLKDVNSVILSENASIKYFGDENPIGRELLIKFSENRSKLFKVAGVAEAFPVSRTISFQFLVNIENLRTSEATYNFHDWGQFVNATLIQVDNPSNLPSIAQGMETYRVMQNEAVEEEWAISSFGFEPLATLHERSGGIRDDISRSSDDNYSSIIFLSFVAGFMLLLACFNYINIAIVTATKRLKEIGVRKTMGASRRTIIVQFLAENLVLTLFALILGLILGATVFIPWFENLWHFNMGFSLLDQNLWIYLPLILVFTGIASGSYPAFYISGFKVTGILKGSVKFGKKNALTKVLLGFQFFLACVFITTAVTFTLNTSYLANRSWGYNNRDVIYAAVPDQAAFEKLAALMIQNPNGLSISGSSHHLGKSHTTAVLQMPDRQFEVARLSVGPRYFETMGLRLDTGRVFTDQHESDRRSVVVNETFVRSLGLENPLGQVFRIDSLRHEIIGVVQDFHNYSFSESIKPTVFKVADKAAYRYLSLKVRSGSERETYEALQAAWAQLYPEVPFEGGFQEDVWGNFYNEIAIHGQVWHVFAFLAVILASLGFYGLISLNVAGRVREFSIRKILGAGIRHIADSITREYVVLLGVVLIIAAPVSYFVMKLILSFAYSYHMPITFEVVAIAVAILIFVLLLTASTQLRKVIKSNPVDGLKVE